MPAIEGVDLNQVAVYWAKIGNDRYGEPIVAVTGVEIACRWNSSRRKVVDAQGNSIALDGDVVVNQVIIVDSIMLLGYLTDYKGDGTDELYQVKLYNDVPDLKNRNTRKIVGVMRHKGLLPVANT